jgi:hypothetical protein
LSTAPIIEVPSINRSLWRSPPSDLHFSGSHSLGNDSVDDLQFGEA